MRRFIELTMIHPNNVDGDSQLMVPVDEICMLQEATSIDRKQRPEVKTIVHTKFNFAFATDTTAKDVLDKMNEVV